MTRTATASHRKPEVNPWHLCGDHLSVTKPSPGSSHDALQCLQSNFDRRHQNLLVMSEKVYQSA